jgi:cobalt-zinc-cadmium efflux system outer membrane protein
MIESAAAALRYGTQIEQLIAEPLSAPQNNHGQPSNLPNQKAF